MVVGPALSVSALRGRFEARIAALAWNTSAWGAGAWWLAPVPYALFGVSQVPDAIPATKAHGAFVVGTPETPQLDGRQAPGSTVLATTRVLVKFLAKHTPGPTNSKASETVAENLEQALIEGLFSPGWRGTAPVITRLELVSAGPRTCPEPGNWFVHELAWTAMHHLQL